MMEFDYYNDLAGEPFENYYKFVREVADEDSELCTTAQANLEKGIYSVGCLNPEKETGVSCKLDPGPNLYDIARAQTNSDRLSRKSLGHRPGRAREG